MLRIILCFLLVFVLTGPVAAREIAGVSIPETVAGPDGVELKLNGAGIRSKLFFKIYIAQLYLEKTTSDGEAVLADGGRKRMAMHFLYDEVTKEKLVAAWNDGFTANLDHEQLTALAGKIEKFNAMFDSVRKSETIELDYVPGNGMSVKVAGQEKGVVEGDDFASAVFAIWLGEKPVTNDLKKQLLGM